MRDALEGVSAEMWRIVAADDRLAESVTGHLMSMRGKMFRPTLLLLSSAIDGEPPSARAVRLAAVAELVHLATLVHDDSVDHSHRPPRTSDDHSLFSHQAR